MSSQAPEGGRSRRENVFTRKIGPLPMWQWFLIALAMVGVYVIYQYRKNNAAATAASNTAAGTSTGGTTGAGQVPQFVNQTNTYVAPPSAPQPPPSSHAGGGRQGPTGKAPTNATMRAMGINNLGNLLQYASKAGFTVNAVYNGQPVSSSSNNNPQYWHYPVDSLQTSGKTITAVISPT